MAAPEEGPGATGSGGNGSKKPGIKLRVSEQVAAGVYANSMVVQHGPNEFVMDFALVTGGSGQVVARVITSPAHMKRVLVALQDNLRKYESLYGRVEPPKAGV